MNFAAAVGSENNVRMKQKRSSSLYRCYDDYKVSGTPKHGFNNEQSVSAFTNKLPFDVSVHFLGWKIFFSQLDAEILLVCRKLAKVATKIRTSPVIFLQKRWKNIRISIGKSQQIRVRQTDVRYFDNFRIINLKKKLSFQKWKKKNPTTKVSAKRLPNSGEGIHGVIVRMRRNWAG